MGFSFFMLIFRIKIACLGYLYKEGSSMKSKIKAVLTTGSLLVIMLASQVGAQSAYVLSQSVNKTPVEASTCVRLIRQMTQADENDTSSSQDLASQMREQESDLASLEAQAKQVQAELAKLDDQVKSLHDQLDQALDSAYQALVKENPELAQASEDQQAATLANQPQVASLQEALTSAQTEQQEKQADLERIKSEMANLDYERHQKEDQLEQSKSNKTALNACLLYPYSSHYVSADSLPLNPASETLADYLVQVNQVLKQIVPLAYQKLKYQEIETLFSPETSNMDEVNKQLEGKQDLHLSPEGETYYQYAQELSLFDVEILANLALRHYYQSGDKATLQAKFDQVYQLKIGQYRYLTSINQEVFQALKQGLADYLNAHHYGAEAQGKLQALVDRYQLHLVRYHEASQSWQAVDIEDDSFLTVPELMSVHPEANSSESELGDSNYHNSTRDWTPSDYDRQIRDSSSQGHQETSNSSQSQSESSSESSADNNPETLKRLKERLNKRQAKNANHKSKSKHQAPSRQSKKEAKASANSDQANENSQDKGKGSVKLPDTGEQAFYMTLALALCGLAAIIVAVYLYRRYRERKKLKDIHFD
ncbi:LPXTG-motif protein cell wall anchor domain protein [Abiotrophia defectiva ATCC 49176]|uniref:LPXTG-motif protein cell wall anchor domain protein n=2 Tax=Abiotrophia defectiva TaxID=46125 RepID=W1Q2N5_ABIDE|nr:LPXTG-motif protein cell wall anchor domain protein [Abiotrophia defectiva ATCC 49176]